MSVVYAMDTASIAMPDGSVVTIHKGEHYRSDHPVVVRCPGFFSDDAVYGLTDSVEMATAVPGERRSVRRG